MKYGLNDNVVKRIAALAYHQKGGNAHGKVSSIYHSLNTPEGIMAVQSAHMTDAMQYKFADKDAENSFKVYLAKAAAINRGTLDPVPEVKPTTEGKRSNKG